MLRSLRDLIIVLPLLVAAYSLAPAQGDTGSWYAGLSVEVALPVGDFRITNGIGFGGSARVGYIAGQDVLLTAGIGYLQFGGGGINIPVVNVSLPTPGTSVVPLLAGARYLFNRGHDARPFIGGEAGFYIVRTTIGVAGFSAQSQSTTSFGGAPLAGVRFRSSDNVGINALAKVTTLEGGTSGSRGWAGLAGEADFTIR